LTAVKGTYMSKDIIQLILEDHNRGREMYRQYMAPTTNSKQKQLLAWHMIRESYVHSYKEEEVCARGGGLRFLAAGCGSMLAAAEAAARHVDPHKPAAAAAAVVVVLAIMMVGWSSRSTCQLFPSMCWCTVVHPARCCTLPCGM
jgi:hypothetical protein